mmetsp:Transcript_63022/g.117903  ORF Transcript_63022/g.117903 Transcript_63022/m.117903 type:complete len:381 (+) Transcript_63022:60-1202(+)
MQQQGVVKSFNPLKGWGFITSSETGGDLLLLKTELGGYSVTAGDQVTFSVRETPKGLQAADVKILTTLDGSQTFIGLVKSFNAEKGFGFLSSDAVTQTFGKDVFFMRSQLPGGNIMPGAQAAFKAQSGERGPCVVGEIQDLSGFAGNPMQGAMGGGMMQGQMMGQQMGIPQMGGQHMMQQLVPMPGVYGPGVGVPTQTQLPNPTQVFYGVVKQINQEKGWGHITCQALSKFLGKNEIFILRSSVEELPGVAAGWEVCFTVTNGPKGPHATNLKAMDQSTIGQTYSGTVKTYNEGKGWGFIDSPQAKQVFGSDIFLHQNALAGDAVAAGDMVSFSIDLTGGRPSASNVEKIGGGGAAGGGPGFKGYGAANAPSMTQFYQPY